MNGIGGTGSRNIITSELTASNLDRAAMLLAGFGNGVSRAAGSALTRAAASGKTVAKRAVTQEYALSQSDFTQYTHNRNHVVRNIAGGLTVEFGFAGYVIPLLKFNTKVGSDGRLMTKVKRQSTLEILKQAFTAQMAGLGGHRGVYERESRERFPIRELYGPATPQMMYSNDAVLEQIDKTMAETFAKRIEHEILRVMNGWGR